ncbi:hypothetical protein ACI7RC_00010 [Brevibacillus sp. B_LB10_24]|uniref:hypothetical protein n=1 Tax=Brevibacillus sp. B_LB10_24 TaxID=3380645 RepID=UPI0038BCC917
MKKLLTKPMLTVLAAATIAGGFTPVWAWASSGSGLAVSGTTSTPTKIVFGADNHEYVRYNLSDLQKNNPEFLQMLLNTQTDNLYLIVDTGDIHLDTKWVTYIDEHNDEWLDLYYKHYKDIYFEVRYGVEDGFVKLDYEQVNDTIRIKGKVADDVTKVVATKPNGDQVEILHFTDNEFTLSIPAVNSTTPKYATLTAYVGDKVVSEQKIRVNTDKENVVDHDLLIFTEGTYNQAKGEVQVKGIVSTDADEVYVTYGGEKKRVNVKKLWNGIGSFTLTLKVKSDERQAVIEVYKGGTKVDSATVKLVTINSGKPSDLTYTIKGTAEIVPNRKELHVSGSISAQKTAAKGKVKLYVVAPDGKKHEVKLKDNQFDEKISYHDRSNSAKTVRLELYSDDKLIAQADIAYTVNPAKPAEKPGKGKAKGHDKQEDKKKNKDHKKGHHDDDDDDDDDED